MRLTRLGFGIALAGAAIAWVVPAARATDPPTALFRAFQAICLDTDAVPGAVTSAVNLAGGWLVDEKYAGPYVKGRTIISTKHWTIAIGGQFVSVVMETWREAATEKLPAAMGNFCGVIASGRNTASADAARDWAGVAITSSTDDTSIYQFVLDGRRHVAMPEDGDAHRKAYIEALAQNRSATVIVALATGDTSLTIIRSRVAEDQP